MRQACTGCLKPLINHLFQSVVLRAMLLLVGSILLVPQISSAQSSGPVLSDARIGEREGETRFVLEFDRAVPYKVFTLAGPDRVVIDLPSVDWKGPGLDEVRGRGLIGGYRHGLFKPGITRVVIDLSAPATVMRHFALDAANNSGPRVVIDLGPVSKTTPSTVAMESAGRVPMRRNWRGLPRRLQHQDHRRALTSASWCWTLAMGGSIQVPSAPVASMKRRSFCPMPKH